jgi:hypothetical protein
LILSPTWAKSSSKAGDPSMAIYSLPRYGRAGNPGRLHLAMDSNHNALEGSPGQVTLVPLYAFQALVWPSPTIPILPRSLPLYQYHRTIRAQHRKIKVTIILYTVCLSAASVRGSSTCSIPIFCMSVVSTRI